MTSTQEASINNVESMLREFIGSRAANGYWHEFRDAAVPITQLRDSRLAELIEWMRGPGSDAPAVTALPYLEKEAVDRFVRSKLL